MKRIDHKLTTNGVQHCALETLWRDKFKRPVTVKITTHRQDEGAPRLEETLAGEPAEVDKILAGLAEIAWERGWRPRGLGLVLARMVEVYKEPPEER